MALLADIFRTHKSPGKVIGRLKQAEWGEERLLVVLMAACFLGLVAQLPELAAKWRLAEDSGVVARDIGAALLGALIFAPLFFYVLAGIVHLASRILGARGSGRDTRLAFFWTLLSIQPIVIAWKIIEVQIAPDLYSGFVPYLLLLWFLYLLIAAIRRISFS